MTTADQIRAIEALCSCRGYSLDDARRFVDALTPDQVLMLPLAAKRQRVEDLISESRVMHYEFADIPPLVQSFTEEECDAFLRATAQATNRRGRPQLADHVKTLLALKRTTSPSPVSSSTAAPKPKARNPSRVAKAGRRRAFFIR